MSCPGWYCGRINESSECGACMRGFRRNDTTFICEPCQESPLFYDWLYLGFMVLLALVLHWFFIDMVAKGKRYVCKTISSLLVNPRLCSFSKDVLILHTTAFIEVALSSILSVLLTSPTGKFEIRSCRVRNLADWYTLLHNPTPNYEKKIYCTQEAVYPL